MKSTKAALPWGPQHGAVKVSMSGDMLPIGRSVHLARAHRSAQVIDQIAKTAEEQIVLVGEVQIEGGARYANARRVSHSVCSQGVRLNVDAFEQTAVDAPVIIFNHGGGGYGRLFTTLALELFDRGYTVLLPDQIGQGLSGGTWRELSLAAFVRNIVDVSRWARQQFGGPLFLAGGSLGGGLAYYAGAAGAPVDGLICHNLYEFGHAEDVLAASRLAGLAALPGVPHASKAFVRLAARVWPQLPLPYRRLSRFDRMVDRRERNFYAKWRADPVPLRRITLGYMASLFDTPPAIALADNTLPILVINPIQDEMVSPEVTRRNYARLGGPKSYAELPYRHWALSAAFVADWVAVVDAWRCQQKTGVRMAA